MDLIDVFLKNIELRNGSENTIRSYKTSLTEFTIFLRKTNPLKTDEDLYRSVNANILDGFLLMLKNDGNEISTINNRLAAVKKFYSFLYISQEVIDINTRNKVKEYKKIKQNKVDPVYMTENEARKFLEASKYVSSKATIRNFTMVYIMLTLGLRVSEVSKLKIKDICFENLTLLVNQGKGKKDRTIEFTEDIGNCLKEYFNFRKPKNDDEFLFLNSRGEQLKPEGIRKIIKKAKELSGVNKEVTPHILRHTCASLLMKNDIGIEKIQKVLGHESITTTTRYAHMYDGDMREAISANPLIKKDEKLM